jgi:E-phenylitaconyl-CoA hydratase
MQRLGASVCAGAFPSARPASPKHRTPPDEHQGKRRYMEGDREIQFETLTYHVRDGVALIELDRPQRLNAVNSVMSRELPDAWRRFDGDPSAIVAIVTGAGDKAFCTGADLADLPAMIVDDHGVPDIASIRWTPLQNQVWKPVICAINGAVVGGGLHFVAECDIVLSCDHAEFSDTHVSVGLVSALEPIALARRMPMGAVLQMALAGRGEKLTAQDALRLGMVNEVHAGKDLLDRARALAGRIAQNSPSAMARTKKAIWGAKETGLHAASMDGWNAIVAHGQSHDFAEGIRAFSERRRPRWTPYSGRDDR